MRKLYWLLVLLTLTFCKGPGRELSPRDYYILGRDALLAQDYMGAINYFERSLSAAEKTGDAYYQGYACLQLSSLLASQNRYSVAIEYALLAADSLSSCGEHVGACLSRLDMAWQYMYLGEYEEAKALLTLIRTNFPSQDSPLEARLLQLEESLSRITPASE